MTITPAGKKKQPEAAAGPSLGDASGLSSFPWPPVLYLGAVAIALLLPLKVPAPWFGSPLSDILFAIGVIGVATAIFIYVGSFRALHRARTTIRPNRAANHLVTTGPFAVTRNPIYLANTLLLFSFGFVSGNPWFILLAIMAAIATTKLSIEPEERHLELKFGKQYRNYRAKVRRWI